MQRKNFYKLNLKSFISRRRCDPVREKLYTVRYRHSTVTTDPWEITEELTTKELIEVLKHGMNSLIEAKEVIRNGMPKYREVP